MSVKIKLTKAQKRVQIAKDVIKQVKAGLTKVQQSRKRYCEVSGMYGNAGVDLKSIILKKPCFGCAKGGMFLAHVRRFDKVEVPQMTWENDCPLDDEVKASQPLLSYFSKRQLDLIECAYEGVDISEELPAITRTRGVLFFEKFPGTSSRKSAVRLTQICKNIVRNNGDFKP